MSKTKNTSNNLKQLKLFIEANEPRSQKLNYSTNDYNIDINVYPVIPFTKRTEMINEIIDSVFMNGKDTIKTYTPEFLTLSKKYAIIKYYTDLVLPNKLDDMWLVLNYTTIYQDVVKIIGEHEIEDIFSAVDHGIEAYKQYLIVKTDTKLFLNKILKYFDKIKASLTKENLTNVLSVLDEIPQGAELRDIANSIISKIN